MESVAKITGQICAICQPGLSVISLPLSTDDTLYQVPIRLAWHFLCRNENVQLVQHNRELTLALARRIGLDLQSRLEGEPLTGSSKSTLFLRTFFPPKWDQPDKQYSYSSGSSCGTAKAFAERCIREYKCSMLIIDDSQKYPASSPEVLIGLHEMGKSQFLKIVNFRADKVRTSYTREALKSDPRVALYAGVAKALPADVCALAMLPARSGGIALYLDSIAVRLTATLTLKPTPIERPTNIQAVSPPPFLLASPNAIARIQRNALIAIVVLVTLLGYFLANVHIPK